MTEENMQGTAVPRNCRDRAFVEKYFLHVKMDNWRYKLKTL